MAEPKNESIRDTWLDFMGYALMGLAMEDGVWHDRKGGIFEGGVTQNAIITDLLLQENILFSSKMSDYGVKDMTEPGQVLQRVQEKIERLKNLSGDGIPVIKMKLLSPEGRPLEYPQKSGDVGYDMRAARPMVIPAKNQLPIEVPTDLAIELPQAHWGEIRSRSSAAKMGLEVTSCVIDQGYRGPLFACVYNRTDKDIHIEAGQRISQLIVQRAYTPLLTPVDELEPSDRGADGFGSTGKF